MDDKILQKVDTFFTQYKKQTFKKGEILIQAGEAPAGVFYLKSGMVKEYTISKNGDELIVNIFKSVAFFPMSWAINKTPNDYFYEAMTDSVAWRAPREDVITFIQSNSDVLYDLMSRVYKGVDGMLTRMTHLMSGNAYPRLITELLINAKRFHKDEHSTIALAVAEKDLAAQSGMTRETVSRQMKILKEKGLVVFDKSTIVIPDLKELEEELMN